jgi:hypothetical protein
MKQVIYPELVRRWAYVLLALAALTVFSGLVRAEETVSLSVFPGAGDESPMVLEAGRSNVVNVGNGYMVYGDVWLVTPVHKMKLAGSSLFLEFAPGTQRITRLVGKAFVPSPYGDSHVVIKQPAMAEVGMDFGKNLGRLDVPLNDDRSYLFFHFDAGFEMEVGATDDPDDTKAFTISVPVGASATLILDPQDPFFYFAGAITTPKTAKDDKDSGESGKQGSEGQNSGTQPGNTQPGNNDSSTEAGNSKKQGEQASGDQPDGDSHESESDDPGLGFGLSVKGLIPFRPQTTFGIEDEAREFQGERIVTGTFPLAELPIEVSGHMIEDVRFGDSEKAVDPLGVQFGPSFERGVNGDFSVSLAIAEKATAGMIEFGFPLGSATAAVQVIDDVQHCYLSGVIAPDTSWIPDWVPIKADAELKTYGYLSSVPESFRLHMDGSYSVNAAPFGEMAHLDLGDVLKVEGVLHLDRAGFKLSGITDRNLGPFVFESKQQIDVWVPFDKNESPYLRVEGLIQVGGMSTDGVLLINNQGAFLNGRLVVPDLDMQVKAGTGVENGSAYLLGQMSVPDQFNTALQAEILKEAEAAQQEIGNTWDQYQQATKNYDVELSLRGARKAVPPVCDAIISGINSGIESGFKKWPKKWGVSVPGKSAAKKDAYKQAAPEKNRLAKLRDQMRTGDNASVRAALKAAIQDVLAHQTVKIKVSVLGTIYNKDVISSTNEAWLRKALAAIDSLPEASDRKIQAEQIWNAAPKREVLMETKKAIETGAGAVPTIEAIGFHHTLFSSRWLLLATIRTGGSESEVQLGFDPANPAGLGTLIGQAVAPTL